MRQRRNEILVGFFVIVGFLILSVVTFFVSGVYFFRTGYSLHIRYDYVSILDKGAPVRMAGVRVGEVSKVKHILEEDGEIRVDVKLFIESDVKIRDNYMFNIRGTHILSEPHIEITPLPGGSRFLEDGDTVEGADLVPMEDLFDKLNGVGTELESLLRVTRDAFEQDEFHAIFSNLSDSSRSMNEILARVERGDGTVGKLVSEDLLYQDMRDFIAELKARPWRLLKKDDERKKFLWIF